MKIHYKKDALKFLHDKRYEGIVCPKCGCGYTHVHHVGTLVGSDPDEAVTAYEGTQTTGTTAHRRSAIEVVLWCEGCHELFNRKKAFVPWKSIKG